jgi:hypothetical protein
MSGAEDLNVEQPPGSGAGVEEAFGVEGCGVSGALALP